MNKTIASQYICVVGIILLLIIPALFINLGLSPLIGDEAIRGLVAFEMKQSGDLITPTINGELYFNKPPMYNWIVLGFFNLFHSYSLWVLRLPAVVSLLLFGLVIFLTTRKHLGARVAFLSSMVFITCGRILFYDSMRGLIDLSFSLIVFLNFYVIYYYLRKKNYALMYLLSYSLASIAFLMKGMPALLFQGLTLLAALTYFKSLKKLFHPAHLAGLVVIVVLVGGYYFLLWEHNREPAFFRSLVTESTKRTFVEYGWWNTVKHLFTFPFEQVYHLLPWSVMLIFLFRRSFYSRLRENEYTGYLALVFAVNIPVYWISVETYPRYLFMLYPIVLILLISYYSGLNRDDKYLRIFWILVFILTASVSGYGTWYFLTRSSAVSLKLGFIFGITLAVVLAGLFMIWKNRQIRLELLIIVLLLVRISFNLSVLPERLTDSPHNRERIAAEKISEITRDGQLMLYPVAPISNEIIYYLSTARNEIIQKEHGELKPGVYYIFDARDPLRNGEEIVMDFGARWKSRKLRLSIIKEEPAEGNGD